MMTSYWAVGGSMLTNIVDMFKLKDEKDTKTRLIAIACTVLPRSSLPTPVLSALLTPLAGPVPSAA